MGNGKGLNAATVLGFSEKIYNFVKIPRKLSYTIFSRPNSFLFICQTHALYVRGIAYIIISCLNTFKAVYIYKSLLKRKICETYCWFALWTRHTFTSIQCKLITKMFSRNSQVNSSLALLMQKPWNLITSNFRHSLPFCSVRFRWN